MEIATLAGGCFWCLEAVYDRMKGVESVESGYIGGKGPNPTYQTGCTGRTRHPQAGEITFDPQGVSFFELLEAFFSIPHPTTPHPPGHHLGTPHPAAIF